MMQRLIQDCTIGSKIPPLVTQDLFENTCRPSIKSVVNPRGFLSPVKISNSLQVLSMDDARLVTMSLPV